MAEVCQACCPLPKSPRAARLWDVGFILRHRSETINKPVPELPGGSSQGPDNAPQTWGISFSFLQEELIHAQPPQSHEHRVGKAPRAP